MEKTILALGVLALLGATLYMIQTPETQTVSLNAADSVPPQVYDLYQDWKKKNNKKYASEEQDQYRLTVFYSNYQYIQDFYNGPEQSYTLEFTQFMDITNEEFQATYLGYIPKEEDEQDIKLSLQAVDLSDVPNSVDWRTQNAVTPVKNQGQCGSCWSFSTTGALEGLSAVSGKGLQSFSEQQLVDCDTSEYGCNGGLMENAFRFVASHGIVHESEYSYTARKGTCRTSSGAFRNRSYKTVRSCDQLKSALASGPVSVAVDANKWQFYGGGVFSNCGTSLDHGVLAVGFDSQGNWIVKNSWGTSWGEKGYIRLASGNTCGLCNQASQPTL